ncbi:MAG: Gfo/Idh/MocA family oxidoreductase [Chloroflexi bacterium]|nr:Gfo/Idh/MocA family oxidoreductase [Chloroflexota bacterium]
MAMLRWAIVGPGRHSNNKMAPAITSASNAGLAAVVSRDLGRARDFSKRHTEGRATAYDSYDAMLRDSSVDAVYIASPNALHAEQTLKAAQAGKHVLCEKPMALTMEDCRRMVEGCQRHNVRLGVCFHLRHHPGHQEMREMLRSGTIGEVALAQAQFAGGVRGQTEPPPRSELQRWWEDPDLVGAGAFMGSGVHAVDLLRYLLGQEVVQVAALTDGQRPERPLEHVATLLLRFRGGALATVHSSRRIPDPRNDVVLYGSLGRLACYGSVSTTLMGELEVVSQSLTRHESYGPHDTAMYRGMVEAFGQCVERGEEPSASGWDGLKVAQVTLAMLESQRTGRTVTLGP